MFLVSEGTHFHQFPYFKRFQQNTAQAAIRRTHRATPLDFVALNWISLSILWNFKAGKFTRNCPEEHEALRLAFFNLCLPAICYSPEAGELAALIRYTTWYHCSVAYCELMLNSNTISFDLLGSRLERSGAGLVGRSCLGCQVVPPRSSPALSQLQCAFDHVLHWTQLGEVVWSRPDKNNFISHPVLHRVHPCSC